jgi:hypothetical protein
MTHGHKAMIGLCAALGAAVSSLPAQAKIACQNGYQNVQGSWFATPFCQDELVAEVAHQFGVKASASAIRNNPNFKREVCRLIGQDIRIKETCAEVDPYQRGNF